MMKETAASPAAVSSCRKSLFATTRHLSELQKALKNGDHHRVGHPFRVSRTHPSAPLTKGSRSFGWPRNRRISCGGFVVSKKSFRHDETSFRASKSSERWGSSSCRTPLPGFPHTPFRPVDVPRRPQAAESKPQPPSWGGGGPQPAGGHQTPVARAASCRLARA